MEEVISNILSLSCWIQ